MQELTAGQVQLDAKLEMLAQSGRETQERFNAFILVVERYINERRNGNKHD